MVIAFDVDDTLIIPSVATWLPIDTPNYETIAIYKWFQSQWHYMVIWSWWWVDYARMWAVKLWLQPNEILEKKLYKNQLWTSYIDICFDDCDVDLAIVNIKVKRLNNSISRKEWNEHKNNIK